MHEQSETVGSAKTGYKNVYGKRTPQAGQPLPKKYRFEQETYPTVKRAVHAARKRSSAEGRATFGGLAGMK